MKKVATLRIFADHYQFWVYDGDQNPFEPLPVYTDESLSLNLPRKEDSLVMAAYNLGKEPSPLEEALKDDAFLEKRDWERYELYVCPDIGVQDGPYENTS